MALQWYYRVVTKIPEPAVISSDRLYEMTDLRVRGSVISFDPEISVPRKQNKRGIRDKSQTKGFADSTHY